RHPPLRGEGRSEHATAEMLRQRRLELSRAVAAQETVDLLDSRIAAPQEPARLAGKRHRLVRGTLTRGDIDGGTVAGGRVEREEDRHRSLAAELRGGIERTGQVI